MCSRRSAAACRRFSDTRPRAARVWKFRCAEAPGAARLEGQDRHRGLNLLPEIDRCENRRTRRRLCLSGQGQSEDATPGHRNGFQQAAFFPLCSWNSGVEKAHGRIEWRAIDVLPAEAAGIQGEWPTVRQICRVIRSRQVKKNAEWQKPQHEVVYLVSSLPTKPRHRRCWASIAIIGGSRSCIETRTSSSARTATRIVATTLLERFSPSPASFSKS